MNWVVLSLIGLLSLSTMSTLITVMARKGLPVSFILLSIGVMFVILYSLQTFVFSSFKPQLNLNSSLILIGIGVLSVIGNLAMYQGAKIAPNPGLAVGIVGAQSVVVAVLAFIFLKDKLTFIQVIGIFLGIVSIFLISLGGFSEKSQKPLESKKLESRSK